MAVPYHTHTFDIPTASPEEAVEGTISDKVVVPSSLPGVISAAVDASISATTLFASRSAASAAFIDPSITTVVIKTLSTSGDEGRALYEKVISEPAHDAKFQSADGAWWGLSEAAPNVRMFGAIGDNVTDDTAAFGASKGFTNSPFVPDGEYVIDGAQLDISTFKGGPGAVVKFKTGSTVSLSTAVTENRMEQIYWQEIAPAPGGTLSLNAAPQSIGICADSVFMTQNVYSPNITDGVWDPTSVVRIAEFPFARTTDNWDVTNNTNATAAIGYVDLLGLGHGVGSSVIEEGGQRWLYSSLAAPTTPTSGTACNFGTGYTKTKWQGSSTLQADVQVFRGLKDVFSAEVCVSTDGKLLVFAGYKFLPVVRDNASYYQTIPWCVVFDRATVEAAVDPTTVNPLYSFKIASLAPGNLGYGVGAALAGVACDGKNICFLHSGAQNVGARAILVYTVSGDFIKPIAFDGMASIASTEFRNGSGGKVCFAYEIEGLAFYRDALVSCSKPNFCTPSAVVPYKGKRFIPTANSTNVTPSNIASWARTEAAATVADWDAATNYTAPSGLVYHKYLTALVPSGLYARPHPVNGGLYIDAPSAAFQGFGDAGFMTSSDFYVSRYDRQLDTGWPILEYRSSGLGRLYHADYLINNPGYDTASYFGQFNYDYNQGMRISGGPSVAKAATLELGNERNTGSGALYATLWADGVRAMLWGVNNISYKNFNPNATNTLNLGSASARWATGYVNTVITNTVVIGVRVVTAAGGVTVTAADGIVVVNKAAPAATAVSLPASPASGQTVTIKDGRGDAATNNITITPNAGQIDGASTKVINTAYGSVQLVYSGSMWLSV